MAYCEKCGAYIPDGQTKCLACGYDKTEEVKFDESGAAAQRQKKASGYSGMSSEELRRELERQRRIRQEENRRWAETERARRQASDEQKARNDDYRKEESKAQAAPINASEPAAKLFSALSYFSILFILPYIFCGSDNFARFHAKQGLGLFIFGAIADVIGSIFPVAWLLWLFRIYCVYKGVTAALGGRTEPLPYLGKYIKY